MTDIERSIQEAREELKRADHLVFVSLKYTRTVDVIASVIGRLINAHDFCLAALIEFLNKRKKNKVEPVPYRLKKEYIRTGFKNKFLEEFFEFSDLMRRIMKSDHGKREEFRKNVTLIATENGVVFLDVNMELLKEYFVKTGEYVDEIEVMVTGKKKND